MKIFKCFMNVMLFCHHAMFSLNTDQRCNKNYGSVICPLFFYWTEYAQAICFYFLLQSILIESVVRCIHYTPDCIPYALCTNHCSDVSEVKWAEKYWYKCRSNLGGVSVHRFTVRPKKNLALDSLLHTILCISF